MSDETSMRLSMQLAWVLVIIEDLTVERDSLRAEVERLKIREALERNDSRAQKMASWKIEQGRQEAEQQRERYKEEPSE